MLPGLPFLCFFYRFLYIIYRFYIVIMLFVKLFIYFFSLLNRKFNEDSKSALKTVIFLLQIIL